MADPGEGIGIRPSPSSCADMPPIIMPPGIIPPDFMAFIIPPAFIIGQGMATKVLSNANIDIEFFL